MAAQHLTVFEAMLDGDLGKVMIDIFWRAGLHLHGFGA